MCWLVCVQVLAFIPLFLVSLGGVVNTDGQYLYSYYSRHIDMDYNDYVAVEFGGALGALLFYVSENLLLSKQYKTNKFR